MNTNNLSEAEVIVSHLSIDEKIALLSGKDFWTTKPVGGVPSITMTDGPHGVRLASGSVLHGKPATCFPTASALAATWNIDMAHMVGEAIGIEAQSMGVNVILGPGVNMKRSPLGGRNFEYFSEDPYLSSEMAIAYVKAMQSQGVGTSLKHFAANNQEYERMNSSSDIDERPLHEIYLRAFERTVRNAHPWSLMASYNRINGTRATESEWLLTDLLHDTWGHKGIVVSDWMAAALNRPESLTAGTHLEMPGGNTDTTKELMTAVANGVLSEQIITERTQVLVDNILKVHHSKREGVTYDVDEHHALAQQVAREAIVLLKNNAHVLPIDTKKISSIAIIGHFAKQPRYQGGGSSQITPTKLDTLYDALETRVGSNITLSYAEGYHDDGTTTDALLKRALDTAAHADVTLVVVGLPQLWEFEGVDRQTIDLPDGMNKLIHQLSEQNNKIVVSLANGSAVAMPWLNRVDAVLEGWLGGQAGASAMADVIMGDVNPSGRLSESFPVRIEDTPAYPDFPNKTGHARYGEGLYVGYRWYNTRHIKPLFPFGFGLSYSEFTYSSLSIEKSTVYDDESVLVSVKVRNSGKYAGKEVVQLYVTNNNADEHHPVRELKKFTKIFLKQNETQTVFFTLTRDDFAYYSDVTHSWVTQPGSYSIVIGRSAEETIEHKEITIIARHPQIVSITANSMLKDLAVHPKGKKVYRLLSEQMVKAAAGSSNEASGFTASTILQLVGDMPLNRLPAASMGLMSQSFIDGIVTYCKHEKGFHIFEDFAYYNEVAKLIIKAVLKTMKEGGNNGAA